MSKLDEAISETLSAEDKEYLSRFDGEPAFSQQMFSILRGPMAWIYWLFLIFAVPLGILGLYSAWKFSTEPELVEMIRWGGLTGFCLAVLITVRIVFFMQINTNQILRELKRVELQVARSQARDAV